MDPFSRRHPYHLQEQARCLLTELLHLQEVPHKKGRTQPLLAVCMQRQSCCHDAPAALASSSAPAPSTPTALSSLQMQVHLDLRAAVAAATKELDAATGDGDVDALTLRGLDVGKNLGDQGWGVSDGPHCGGWGELAGLARRHV